MWHGRGHACASRSGSGTRGARVWCPRKASIRVLCVDVASIGVSAANMNYVPFAGGGEALAALLGNQVAAGISGLFVETHPDPAHALSDGPNSWPLGRMRELLETLIEIDRVVKGRRFAEADL